ncbi:MAG TPA: hypothetical protein VIL72_09370, partial [Beijerinckiaceae bacterium]
MSVMRFHRAAAVAAAVLVGAPQAAHAGFFDFLFGEPPPPRVMRRAPPPAPEPLAEATVPEAALPVTRTKPANTALCCKNGEDPKRALLADPTLRPGDAVVTAEGIVIFRGASGSTQHEQSDFVSLAQAPEIDPQERRQLLA